MQRSVGAAAQELTEALRIDPRLTQAARCLSSLLSRQITIGNAQLNPIGLRVALQHQDVSRDAIAARERLGTSTPSRSLRQW